MTFVGRTLGAPTESIAFVPATYDSAFRRGDLPGLPEVDHERAMGLPGAYACTVAVSEDIAKVSLPIFQVNDDGSKEKSRQHPLWDLLQWAPNSQGDTAVELREWMTAFAMNRGRAIAEIIPGPRGPVDQLVPLHPDRYRIERIASGDQVLRYDDPVKRKVRTLTRDELFILRGRFGVGVIQYARRNFELQLSMQRLAREMYGRGLRTPGYLSTDKTLSPTARKALREALDEYMGGGERAGRPLLLDEGMKWETTSITLEDAEFVATHGVTLGDTCRWYRVPRWKIQETLNSTVGPVQQVATDWVVDGLLGWGVRWEQAIRRDLILNPRYLAEHNFESLLRGDTKTRYEAYQIAITFGWMTRAEVREKENLNPIAGLEKPLLPLNMAAQVTGGSPGAGPVPSSGAVVGYLRLLVRDGAARVIRKEAATLGKLAEKTGGKGDEWNRGVRDFYREHAEFTARVLRMPDAPAAEYAEQRAAALIAAGPEVLEHPETESVADLTELALDKSTALQIPGELPARETRSVLDLVEVPS